MKNCIKKSMKASNGITLIALVITIIVLLILAGISISMLSGDNSILQRATDAKERTGIAEVVENAKLDVLAQIAENKGENISKVQLKSILNTYFDDIDNLELPDDLSNSDIKLKANQSYGGYQNIALVDIYNGTFVADENSNIKLGKLSTVSDISALYGETTDYKSTSHPDIEWQLFYADEVNYYLIASDYVPNAELPCNENDGFGATDLLKSKDKTKQYSTYCAKFCSNYNYNDGVFTEGTIYKNGSASTAITENPLTNLYLKWSTSNSYKTSTIKSICAVSYMMDRNKWSSFADGVKGAYAIGGPTIEMFALSYNSKHDTKLGTYETINSTCANSMGYKIKFGTSSWGASSISGLDSSTDNMWVKTNNEKAVGFWLASHNRWPEALAHRMDMSLEFRIDGVIGSGFAHMTTYFGFRPLVAVPHN